MSPASEASYYDGVPVQHIADWQEARRLARIERKCIEAFRRRARDTLGRALPTDWLRRCAQSRDARLIIERADARASQEVGHVG